MLNFLYDPTLRHPHVTPGKAIALTRWTFVSKVMALLFNMLSRFVITFLLVLIFFVVVITFFSKEQVSFNFMVAVTISSDFGARENKFCYCFHCFPIYLLWSDGTQICGLLISLVFVLAGASLISTDLNWAAVFFSLMINNKWVALFQVLPLVFIPAAYRRGVPSMMVAELRQNKPDCTSIVQASISFTFIKFIEQRCCMARPRVKGLRWTPYWQWKSPSQLMWQKKWMPNSITEEGVKSWNTNPFYHLFEELCSGVIHHSVCIPEFLIHILRALFLLRKGKVSYEIFQFLLEMSTA